MIFISLKLLLQCNSGKALFNEVNNIINIYNAEIIVRTYFINKIQRKWFFNLND